MSATVSAIPLHAVEGTKYSPTAATFTSADAKPSVKNFSALITWGDGTTSAGKIKKSGSGFAVTGTHVYDEESLVFYVSSVTITDRTDGTVTTGTNTAFVADAPISVAGKTIKAKVGKPLANVLVALGKDSDTHSRDGDIAATISWGDGTVTDNALVAIKGKKWNITGSHTFATKGTFTATVVFNDVVGGSTARTTSRIIVS